MKKLIAACLAAMCGGLASEAAAGEPKREILGIHLEMTKEEAKKRLEEIGTFAREERKQQEIWRVRDPSFSHVIIGVAKEGKLRYVTAVAREDTESKRVAYVNVGELKQARHTGDAKIKNFQYQWELPATKDAPAVLVVAAGRDEKHLSTYSLKRLGDSPDS